MITFDTYALDNTIDERIERAFNIWDRYGKEAFDDDYRLVPREVYDLQDCHLLSIIQEQQEQITKLKKTIEFELKVIRNDIDFELRIIKNIIKELPNG